MTRWDDHLGMTRAGSTVRVFLWVSSGVVVALAALLVQDAPLALLDEPSSHLDIAQQAAALEVFVGLARMQRGALVMVLHDLHLATRFCDHVIAIGGGRARAGRADEVLTEDALSALYGRPLRRLAGDGLSTFVPR